MYRDTCSFSNDRELSRYVSRNPSRLRRGRKIVNVLLESDRRCPPTSANDYPDSKRERDDEAARAASPRPGSPDRCPPRREHDINTRTTDGEEEEAPAASAADGLQGRRPNPRTTPQLLATKVPSLIPRMCPHAQVSCFVYAEIFTTGPTFIPRDPRMACSSV